MKPFTNEELILSIRMGGRAAEAALGQLYRDATYRRMAKKLARLFDGNAAEAADLWQEGLWKVYEKIRNGTFEERSSVKTFFYCVMRNIALNEHSTRKRRASLLAEFPAASEIVPDESDKTSWKEKTELLDRAVSSLPVGCRQVLELWAAGFSMQEIEQKMGFANLDAAKNKKKNCLKSLREWMLRNPEVAKSLNEDE